VNILPLLPEYTEQEIADLDGLRQLRSANKEFARSGNPAKRALARTRGIAVEIEVRKIHRRAEKRARIAERMASR
jgi:hypothetical protein